MMLDIRDHGGQYGGGKSSPDFIPNNFTTPPSSGSTGSNPRLQIAKTFAFIRRNDQVHHTIDIATGTVITSTTATNTTGSFNISAPVADENDDFIHGYHYEYGLANSKPRAINKNLQKVWEANLTELGQNAGLTKDFVFFVLTGKLYKLRRDTGEVFALTNPNVQSNTQFVLGNTDDDSEILYTRRSDFSLINTITGTTIKSGSLPDVYANSSAYPYGIAIKDGLLHVFTYNSSNYDVYHWVYPANATVFNSTTLVFSRRMAYGSWENGNAHQAVKHTEAGITVATNASYDLINMKLGDKSLKTVSLMEPNLSKINGNGVNYMNMTASGVISAFGSLKR